MSLQNVLDEIDQSIEQSVERLFGLLKIPSISTNPAYRSDCEKAATWLVHKLSEIGFEASLRPTSGHPMVMANGPINGPAKLFYGHYDVQPVDPLEKWEFLPFDPILQADNGKQIIRGRGASDDKGQLMTFIEACRAWKNVTGQVPQNIKFLFEGEEESGSPSLIPFLNENKDELAAEIALICDTGLFDKNTPAIVLMLRGILSEEIIITGANQDLHSGMFGGIAANPNRILAKILASLHDEQNRVTIPKFYENIIEPPPKIRSAWQHLDSRANKLLNQVGLNIPVGELDRSPLEMVWSRPTCEFNGISGGYSGDGFKTVIPTQASAKISFRLVNGQDPDSIRKNFRTFVQSIIPEDCSVDFIAHSGAPASCFSMENQLFEIVHQALTDEWPKPAVYTGCGGSIPIAGHFKEILEIESILAGFGIDNDRIHSPNEKYDMRSFRLGIRSWARVLSSFA